MSGVLLSRIGHSDRENGCRALFPCHAHRLQCDGPRPPRCRCDRCAEGNTACRYPEWCAKTQSDEIIDELEPVKRGVYGGAVGYVSWAGEMDTAIAIRTALVMDQKVVIQAGAGVVADSVPESEWEETLNKARAMLRAVAMCDGE